MDFSVVIDYFPRLMEGAWMTVQLVLVSGILGAALALPIGLARHSDKLWIKSLPYSYIFFFRGTPAAGSAVFSSITDWRSSRLSGKAFSGPTCVNLTGVQLSPSA